MRVLVLMRYGRLGASSRLRMVQYIPWLEREDIGVSTQEFFSDAMLNNRYRNGRYGYGALIDVYWKRICALVCGRGKGLLWIEKEALPWFPAWIERILLGHVPYVLDYDDALFHNYDLHSSRVVRAMLGRRIDTLMRGARLVIAGNDYLAQRARQAGARWVEIVPTVIDLNRYYVRNSSLSSDLLRIVWVGSPSTVQYLRLIETALVTLGRQVRFTLRVVGAEISMPGVDIECLPWSENSEVASITECDIGIMPLTDSPWERGKCGYKLIQYMACGLPVVASPVGVNSQIVRDGENGFLADTPEAWERALGQLLHQASSRECMGRAGRSRVEEEYCVQRVAPRLATLLKQAGAR
ncbi:glycosyl transferase family 1 [Ralstonia insidiosa]|uniref:Glycosyl transferase family 1 n=2 Tax=Ralstonia insidiosa TaxID=190721 RepID=A0A192A254_9RALS|nr:glycosyl transferase family 1 [Ralstonia insidiosa]KAB0474186.1 glycosyltransferase family 4 protein [Ralstonia insidiosa]